MKYAFTFKSYSGTNGSSCYEVCGRKYDEVEANERDNKGNDDDKWKFDSINGRDDIEEGKRAENLKLCKCNITEMMSITKSK